jgi:hypothetical protein
MLLIKFTNHPILDSTRLVTLGLTLRLIDTVTVDKIPSQNLLSFYKSVTVERISKIEARGRTSVQCVEKKRFFLWGKRFCIPECSTIHYT